MLNLTSEAGRDWLIETAPRDRMYRFVNLQDHTAWRVVIHGSDGSQVPIRGHVSYGRGSFSQQLSPGSYWLTWDNTLSMLKPRAGEASRPKLQSSVFSVPWTDASATGSSRSAS